MFLDVLRRRNPAFLQAVLTLHRRQEIPANAYVLDLEAVRDNAAALRAAGDRHGLEVLAMSKQVGRAPGFLRAVPTVASGPGSRSTWPAPARSPTAG